MNFNMNEKWTFKDFIHNDDGHDVDHDVVINVLNQTTCKLLLQSCYNYIPSSYQIPKNKF
jgi:hypothetical protein